MLRIGSFSTSSKKKRLIDLTGHSKSLRRSEFATNADMEEAGCSKAEEDAFSAHKPICQTEWAVSARGDCIRRQDGAFYSFARAIQFECEE